jgi:arylsulfatase A-like enzyme/Tfp pilus assembly protein PilF
MIPRPASWFGQIILSIAAIATIWVCPAWGASQPNIVLITLDSVRADRVGFLGSHAALTPKIDSLAKQSIVFDRAYAQAPGTVSSHATILTGTYPQMNHAGQLGSGLAASVPYLPDLLHSRGYRTAAFVGSVLLDPRNGMAPGSDRGFDLFSADFAPLGSGARQGPADRTSGQIVAKRAVTWLGANSAKPFFLWVHLFDAHAPYGVNYNDAVARADNAMAEVLSALRSHNLFDDAIIVVAADHGEGLGAHGEDTHGIFLYDETIRVPLLLKLPQNQLANTEVKGRVRLLDVAPSILEAAGIPVPSQMQGQSLLRIAKSNPDADQPVYSRSDFPHDGFGWSVLESWRAGKFLYVRAPKPELYDLIADPGATHNLAQTSKATLDTMASQLAAFSSHLGGGAASPALTSTEMQKLASLGYVGLQKSVSGASALTGTDPKDQIAVANQAIGAMASLMAGQPDKAIPGFERAASSQPNAYLPHYGLGVAFAQKQQCSKAIERLHKAIELQPDAPWAHYEMGSCLVKTGDFKTAAVHLELASSRLPEFRGAHLLLAQCYEHLGQAQQAQAEKAKAAQ